MRTIACSMFAFVFALSAAGADDASQKTTLHKSSMQIKAGDYRGALLNALTVLRDAQNDDMREEAMERLEDMGLKQQEIFQLEPQNLTGPRLAKLLNHIREYCRKQKTQELNYEYSTELLRASINPAFKEDGTAQIEVNAKELRQALDLLIQVAVSDGEIAAKAQKRLMELGISGGRVELIQKLPATEQIAPDIQADVIVGLSLRQLKEYREWIEDQDNDDDDIARRAVARDLGTALVKALEPYSKSAVYQKNTAVFDYWKEAFRPEKEQKF